MHILSFLLILLASKFCWSAITLESLEKYIPFKTSYEQRGPWDDEDNVRNTLDSCGTIVFKYWDGVLIKVNFTDNVIFVRTE